MQQIPQATQEQVQRYLWDLYITQYRQRFEYYTFDVVEAWRTGIRAWWEGRRSPLVDVLGPIKSALQWFWDNVLKPPLQAMFSGLGWIADKAIAGISALLQPIRDFLSKIWETVSGLGSWLWSQISSAISGLRNALSSAISGLGSALASVKDALSGAIASTASALKGAIDAVYNGVAAMMSRVAEYIISGLKGLFEMFKQVGEWIWSALKTVIVEPIVAGVEKLLDAIKGAAENIANMIRQGVEPHSPVIIEGTWRRVLGVISGVTGAIITTEIGMHLSNAIHPMKNLEFRQTRDMLIHIAGFHALLRSFHEVYFRTAVEIPLQYELNKLWTPRVLDLNQAMKAWAMGFLSDEELKEHIRYAGLPPRYDAYLMEEADVDLSIPEIIEARRRRILDDDRFVKALKIAGADLKWKDVWDQLAITPLTFTHLRWAAVGGTLDEAWVEEELKRRGYSERAVKELKRAIRFLADGYDIRDCVGQVRLLVKEGFLSKDQARVVFEVFRTLDQPIERHLFVADLAYLYDLRVDQRDEILTLLKKGKITSDAAKQRLITEVGMVPEKAEILVARTLAGIRVKGESAA